MRLGDYPKALTAFRQAVRLDGTDRKAKDHVLLALYASGHKKLAYARAAGRIAQNPTDLVPKAVLALRNKVQMTRFVRQARAFVGEDDFEMIEV